MAGTSSLRATTSTESPGELEKGVSQDSSVPSGNGQKLLILLQRGILLPYARVVLVGLGYVSSLLNLYNKPLIYR